LDSNLKIKVNIANRAYPLTIKPEEEEDIRAAVKHIEEAVKRFEERYSVQDKQDVLAMCALQIATQNIRQRSKNQQELEQYNTFINDLSSYLDEQLPKP
jgi:cell division protein ZapA (FtsZ GTPase activity inhibitor)